MKIKGFKASRNKVISALIAGDYRHEDRSDGEKNLLRVGFVSAQDVVSLLLVCRGDQYSTSKHHAFTCDVHIFKPAPKGTQWYIKVYFLSDLETLAADQTDTMSISVHPST